MLGKDPKTMLNIKERIRVMIIAWERMIGHDSIHGDEVRVRKGGKR
jgi:hypothetical protein